MSDCATCDDTYKVCVVCNQSKLDCNCSDDDIQEYLTEEGLIEEDFEQFKDCPEC